MAAPVGDLEDANVIAIVLSQAPLGDGIWQTVCDRLGSTLRTAMNAGVEARDAGWCYLESNRVVEMTFPTSHPMTMPDCTLAARSQAIKDLEREQRVEVTLQPNELKRLHKEPGLAVFDMDSTLIQQEVIDELARAVGMYDKVAAITEAAMRGEAPYTDFEASLRARVALLKGVPTSIWDHLKASTITFTPGGADLIRVLKARGWKTAVLSGGFMPLATWVKDTLGLDYAFANQLVSDGASKVLTGRLKPGAQIVHAERKRGLLLELAAENGIAVERTIAVGDGSNDLLMMHAAGLGIAFNAKPKVQETAPTRLNTASLLDVLYVLGYSRQQIEDILAVAA